MNELKNRLEKINQKIHSACQRSQRNPADVRLVAVSKTKPASQVSAVAETGQHIFGENRIQEARGKIPQLEQPELEWHLIGPLQRNKVKYAVRLFSMIHSIESLPVAEEVSRRSTQVMPILLQVNVGREPQKHGVLPEKLTELAQAVSLLPGVALRGLMTVPPYNPDPEKVRPYFQELAALAEKLRQADIDNITMDERSMGMSHDFEVAVEEGATLIRVGSAIFGRRE
ncbi:YggS family pyridoxal phosphate-dependent enzyme [Magnetococcales bacterium HHB-1]